jgi:predicted ATPase
MEFIVSRSSSPKKRHTEFPYARLVPDSWDDYGYRTTFSVSLWLAGDKVVELETVKIVTKDQERGHPELPTGWFKRLSNDHCSLGQAMSYYEVLEGLGKDVYEPFLKGLRDMVLLSSVRERFAKREGVVTSLLRFGSAQAALENAPQIFRATATGTEPGQLSFEYQFPTSTVTTEFQFGDVPELPARTIAVIGYNGAGKTRLLAHLAMLAYTDTRHSMTEKFVKDNGRYIGTRPNFGAIVAISYSAFDDFQIPGKGASVNAKEDRERVEKGLAATGSYSYIGLRKVDKSGKISKALKSIDDLTRDFHLAHMRAKKRERVAALKAAFVPIQEEPSFEVLANLPHITADAETWKEAFACLSTGHKIVLNIVVQLCANLERRSIVLFDEPEIHLHPPLLAALLKAVSIALTRHDSFAVVATHSPVVLQEIPGRQVKVLRRYPGSLVVERAETETFGENVGTLTKLVFSLDSSATDFQGVLRELAKRYSDSEIEEFFDGPMSSQARSVLMSWRALNSEADADA